jgi:hypothetical protein
MLSDGAQATPFDSYFMMFPVLFVVPTRRILHNWSDLIHLTKLAPFCYERVEHLPVEHLPPESLTEFGNGNPIEFPSPVMGDSSVGDSGFGILLAIVPNSPGGDLET